jgi:hypothetical protein
LTLKIRCGRMNYMQSKHIVKNDKRRIIAYKEQVLHFTMLPAPFRL